MSQLSTKKKQENAMVSFTIRIPSEIRKEISRVAWEEDRTQAMIIKRALEMYFKKMHDIDFKQLSK